MYRKETNCWPRHIHLLFLFLLIGGLLSFSTVHSPASAQETDGNANIIVTLSSDPSLYVTRGENLSIDVDVENIGTAPAEDVRVTLNFDEDRLSLEDVRFDGSRGWVESHNDDSITLGFRYIEVNNDDNDDGDETRSARLVMNVAPTVPIDEELTLRANYNWNDALNGGAGESNQVKVTVKAAEAVGRTLQDDDGAVADTTPPVSEIVEITREGKGFLVRWSGVDNASGIAYYDVQVCQLPCGSYGWHSWLTNTTSLSEWFGPAEGEEFAFRVRAVDFAGNVEPWTATAGMDTTQAN